MGVDDSDLTISSIILRKVRVFGDSGFGAVHASHMISTCRGLDIFWILFIIYIVRRSTIDSRKLIAA